MTTKHLELCKCLHNTNFILFPNSETWDVTDCSCLMPCFLPSNVSGAALLQYFNLIPLLTVKIFEMLFPPFSRKTTSFSLYQQFQRSLTCMSNITYGSYLKAALYIKGVNLVDHSHITRILMHYQKCLHP